MMRVSNETILSASAALEELSGISLNPAAAAHIAALAREVSAAVGEVVRRRNEIVERHTERDEDGVAVPASNDRLRAQGAVRIESTSRAAFEQEIVALLSEEVEIGSSPLSLVELTRSSGEPVDLKPALILGLGPLFEAVEEQP